MEIPSQKARQFGAWVFTRTASLYMLCVVAMVVGGATYAWIEELANNHGMHHTMVDFLVVRENESISFFCAAGLAALVYVLIARGIGYGLGAMASHGGGQIWWAGPLAMVLPAIGSTVLGVVAWATFDKEIGEQISDAPGDDILIIWSIITGLIAVVGMVFGLLGAFLVRRGLQEYAEGPPVPLGPDEVELPQLPPSGKPWMVAQAIVALVVLILYTSTVSIVLLDTYSLEFTEEALLPSVLLGGVVEAMVLVGLGIWMGRRDPAAELAPARALALLTLVPTAAAGLAYTFVQLMYELDAYGFRKALVPETGVEIAMAMLSFAVPMGILQLFCKQVMHFVRTKGGLLPARFAPSAAAEAEGVPAEAEAIA